MDSFSLMLGIASYQILMPKIGDPNKDIRQLRIVELFCGGLLMSSAIATRNKHTIMLAMTFIILIMGAFEYDHKYRTN